MSGAYVAPFAPADGADSATTTWTGIFHTL
jgi:hypothetical protein